MSLSSNEQVADALRQLYLRSHRVIDRIMSESGASYAKTKLLVLLAGDGPLRSADLAIALDYAPRTVSEAIDGLERDGLVKRTPDPDDRRAKRITLTQAGLVVVKGAEASRRSFIDDVFGVLNHEENTQILHLIGIINDRLAELGGYRE